MFLIYYANNITYINIIAQKWRGNAGKYAVLNHVDNEGTSAIHLAVQNCQTEVSMFFMKAAYPNIDDKIDETVKKYSQ